MAVIGRKGDNQFTRTIAEMHPNDVGYISSDAIAFDLRKRPYLDLTMMVRRRKNWNYEIPIKRIGSAETDFDIDLRGVKTLWTPQKIPFCEGSVYQDEDYWRREIVALPYKERSGKAVISSKTRGGRISAREKIVRDLGQAVLTEEFELAAELKKRLDRLEVRSKVGTRR